MKSLYVYVYEQSFTNTPLTNIRRATAALDKKLARACWELMSDRGEKIILMDVIGHIAK